MPHWMTSFDGLGTTTNVAKKLASSGSLEALKKLVAEFYYTKADRITFIDRGSHWQVQSGEKLVTPIVVRQGKRFVFGIAEPSAVGGLGEVTVVVDKLLEGSYVIDRYKDGSGFFLTSASGRQVVAYSDNVEDLRKYAKSRGAKRVELL